ncbi:hypothetical protein GCM10009540_56340 [Streptomyces turgidiscabies]|nr:hypothetical protein T45_07266 [Streptomyces turgidiscabies]
MRTVDPQRVHGQRTVNGVIGASKQDNRLLSIEGGLRRLPGNLSEDAQVKEFLMGVSHENQSFSHMKPS